MYFDSLMYDEDVFDGNDDPHISLRREHMLVRKVLGGDTLRMGHLATIAEEGLEGFLGMIPVLMRGEIQSQSWPI